MQEFKVNSLDIDYLWKEIKASGESMDTSVKDIDNPSQCSGIMITEYVDRIKKIANLLKSYKKLLRKDALDILASKDKIVEMDRKITNMYKK